MVKSLQEQDPTPAFQAVPWDFRTPAWYERVKVFNAWETAYLSGVDPKLLGPRPTAPWEAPAQGLDEIE